MVSVGLIASSVNLRSVNYQEFEVEKIIIKFVRTSEGCEQNSDRVSKIDVSCHICIRYKVFE